MVDQELSDLLVKFAELSQRIAEDDTDADRLLDERSKLSTQLRDRGFMLSEEQVRSVHRRLLD